MRGEDCWKKESSPWADKGSKRRLWNEQSVGLAIYYVMNEQGSDLPDFLQIITKFILTVIAVNFDFEKNPPATAGGSDLLSFLPNSLPQVVLTFLSKCHRH